VNIPTQYVTGTWGPQQDRGSFNHWTLPRQSHHKPTATANSKQ